VSTVQNTFSGFSNKIIVNRSTVISRGRLPPDGDSQNGSRVFEVCCEGGIEGSKLL
jgi:hypothetical protein